MGARRPRACVGARALGVRRRRHRDLIDGVRDQLLGTEDVRRATRVNDKENFRYVLEPALDEALIDRHAKHGAFIDHLFSDHAMLRQLRATMIEEIYRELRGG